VKTIYEERAEHADWHDIPEALLEYLAPRPIAPAAAAERRSPPDAAVAVSAARNSRLGSRSEKARWRGE
jgi:hypothetical protein